MGVDRLRYDSERNNRSNENDICQLLSTDGVGGGTTNMKINGAITPQKFYIQPPAGYGYTLKRVNIFIAATTFINALTYAGIDLIAAGTGITAYIERDDTIIKDYTLGRGVLSTFEWGLLAGVDARSIDGALDDPFNVRWTFANGGSNINLNGDLLERFVLQVNDDLSVAAIDLHLAKVQGYRYKL